MATLVQFLAAGVKGAESGTATFLQRGTATSAAAFLYNDFERTAQPGTNVITLDANGAAEVYCSVYCDVAIRNSAGTLLRTVTIGNSSNLVEVRSDSFLGDDYDGSPANTANQPVTLTNVLNRWNDSAGAPDFQVLVNGVATDLSVALAGFAGIFINVKDPQYGAEGDGVTNDTTAVFNAISDAFAVGGIVVFPPGTYLIGQIDVGNPNVCLLGFGQATIRASSGSAFVIDDLTAGSVKIISGLKFEGNGSATRALDIGGSNVFIDSCVFDESGFTTGLIRLRDDDGRQHITRCQFTLDDAPTGNPIQHTSGDNKQVIISDCHFTLTAGFTNAVISGSCYSISNCVFDGSQVDVGTYYMIDPHHPTDSEIVAGTVCGCTFIDGGSSGYVFDLSSLGAGCDFAEDGNVFTGFEAPTLTDAGHIYDYSALVGFDATSQIRLGSRMGRTVHLTNDSSDTMTANAILDAENLVIEHSDSVLTVTVPALLPGLTGRVVVFVAPGEPAWSLTFVDSAGFGQVLNTNTISEENINSNAGANEVASCGYLTTIRGDGTLRSLITSEVNHHT